MRVSQYQQDRLASSVVGTAGENQAGNILSNAISSSTSQMANTQIALGNRRNAINRAETSQAFEAVGNEIMQKKAWANQAAAQMKAKQDAITINTHSMIIDDMMHSYAREQENIYKANPYQAKPAFQKGWPEKFKQYVASKEDISGNPKAGVPGNAEVLAGLQKYMEDRVTIEHRQLTDYGFTQGNVNSKLNNKSTTEMLKNKGGATGGDPRKLAELYNTIEKQRPFLFDTEGGNTENVILDMKNKATKLHVESIINSDPQRALAFLDAVNAGQKNSADLVGTEDEPKNLFVLQPDDITALRTRAETAINKQETDAKNAEANELMPIRAQLRDLKQKLVGVEPSGPEAVAALKQIDDIHQGLKKRPFSKEVESVMSLAESTQSAAVAESRQAKSQAAQLAQMEKQTAAQQASAAAAQESARRQVISDADKAVTTSQRLLKQNVDAVRDTPEASRSRVRMYADGKIINDLVTKDDGTRKIAVEPRQLQEAIKHVDDALAKGHITRSQHDLQQGYYEAVRQWQAAPQQSGLRGRLAAMFGATTPVPEDALKNAQANSPAEKEAVNQLYSRNLEAAIGAWKMRAKDRNAPIPEAAMKVIRDSAAAASGSGVFLGDKK